MLKIRLFFAYLSFRSYCLLFLLAIMANNLSSDDFQYNTFNNHGSIGLINIPTARFYEESSFGITLYDGDPDQKITMTSFPFDWMEASFFYMNIEEKKRCRSNPSGKIFCQGYKDKGFNIKLRLKEEGTFPAIAIGINDIAGTGYYSGEYIVSSYGINKIDFHFGVGWGLLNGSKNRIKNPFGYLSDNFYNRPSNTEDIGGQFQPSRYFSGKDASIFYGLSYSLNKNILIKLENDPVVTPGKVGYELPKRYLSYGFDYLINDNLTIGFSKERDNYISFNFTYKNNPKTSQKPYEYKTSKDILMTDNKYQKLIKNIENNGIGVNKIVETSDAIGLELTQFVHPNIQVIEEIISSAKIDSDINKNIKTDLRIANLQASTNFDNEFVQNSKLVYERKKSKNFLYNNRLVFRPFLASREDFFKGALLIENDIEYIIRDNFFLSSNLKYSLYDNFDDLTIPPIDTYPAQVRSDIKKYLNNIDEGIVIGRAQLDYFITQKKDHHFMLTAGILEEMFSGYGAEYLYFDSKKNYAIGLEIFNVKKRDYMMRFGHLDYENITYAANFYYRNYKYIPFDSKISFGEYLAGDEGLTFELSRTFRNGTQFGIFASFTDVSVEQFGEGSFDKGIFFNIPIYGNFINYTWRPLTKDPGARLNRKNSLHNLLVKFKPLN